MLKEHFFTSREQLLSALTADCQQRLQQAISARQQASFLVSGGGTPKPLYQKLAETDLVWKNVNVALVDERWVDFDQDGSNTRFIADNLLQHKAADARFVPMKNVLSSASSGLAECEANYQQLPQPFDLCILGMGPDAHTASLFPFADGLSHALDLNNNALCCAINATQSEVTGKLTERMSLSLHGLLQARQLHLLITGEDKLAVYQQALQSKNIEQTPISALLQQEQVPVHVYWAA